MPDLGMLAKRENPLTYKYSVVQTWCKVLKRKTQELDC